MVKRKIIELGSDWQVTAFGHGTWLMGYWDLGSDEGPNFNAYCRTAFWEGNDHDLHRFCFSYTHIKSHLGLSRSKLMNHPSVAVFEHIDY